MYFEFSEFYDMYLKNRFMTVIEYRLIMNFENFIE